jgi:hypothetical protein
MARYFPSNADTLHPCTLPPRVRCEPKSVVGPPHCRFLKLRYFALGATPRQFA